MKITRWKKKLDEDENAEKNEKRKKKTHEIEKKEHKIIERT